MVFFGDFCISQVPACASDFCKLHMGPLLVKYFSSSGLMKQKTATKAKPKKAKSAGRFTVAVLGALWGTWVSSSSGCAWRGSNYFRAANLQRKVIKSFQIIHLMDSLIAFECFLMTFKMVPQAAWAERHVAAWRSVSSFQGPPRSKLVASFQAAGVSDGKKTSCD